LIIVIACARFVVIDNEGDELDEFPLLQIVRGVENYLTEKTNRDMRRGAIQRFIQNVQGVVKGHPG
jgi:hypothetical protein